MRMSNSLRAVVLAAWVTANGCTAMRELPRADYAARPERKGVRVETREGLVYEFDSATFDPDSLTGYRLRADLEGPVDELATFRIALDDIAKLRTRSVDWVRTGLVGGAVLAGIIAIGLAQDDGGGESGGGPPCARCPLPAGAGR
jgi:hypothetical protein